MITPCPCCHGSGWLAILVDDGKTVLRRDICTHCMGQGEVDTELPRDYPGDHPVPGDLGSVPLVAPAPSGSPTQQQIEAVNRQMAGIKPKFEVL